MNKSIDDQVESAGILDFVAFRKATESKLQSGLFVPPATLADSGMFEGADDREDLGSGPITLDKASESSATIDVPAYFSPEAVRNVAPDLNSVPVSIGIMRPEEGPILAPDLAEGTLFVHPSQLTVPPSDSDLPSINDACIFAGKTPFENSKKHVAWILWMIISVSLYQQSMLVLVPTDH